MRESRGCDSVRRISSRRPQRPFDFFASNASALRGFLRGLVHQRPLCFREPGAMFEQVLLQRRRLVCIEPVDGGLDFALGVRLRGRRKQPPWLWAVLFCCLRPARRTGARTPGCSSSRQTFAQTCDSPPESGPSSTSVLRYPSHGWAADAVAWCSNLL